MELHQQYEIGQLVKCGYDTYEFFKYIFPDDPPVPATYYGIVITAEHESYFFGGIIYEVYCIDGNYRYFLEEELESICWLTFS
jgi:hypothetical protein